MEEKKDNGKGTIVIIVVLVLMVLGLGGYIIYDKFIEKEEESLKATEKINQKQDDNKVINSVITRDETETFLNDLVSTSVPMDLLISDSDSDIFLNSIRYLTLKKKYTKIDDLYIFKQADIKDLAFKYYMRDSFDYIPVDSNFEYDASNQIFRSSLNFGLFGTSPSFEKTRTVDNFNYESGIASFTYQVKITYDDSQLANSENSVDIRNYHIQLIKVNGELRIKSISLM